MWPSAALNSISIEITAAFAAWVAMTKERFFHFGRGGYLFMWMIRPVFDLSIAALIYAGGRSDLIPYVVVAVTANTVVFNSLFWIGEILDRERLKGTLVPLFLAPCSRFSWMIGFAAAGIVETVAAMLMVGLAGVFLFGVQFNPNLLTLAVVIPLYLLSLGGIGLLLSGVGLLIKKSNQLANLVSPFLILLGGIYYPVAELPGFLRIPARALPLGYAMECLSAAALKQATLLEISSSLLPLAGFAVVCPIVGAISFVWLERLVRRRGEIDLY